MRSALPANKLLMYCIFVAFIWTDQIQIQNKFFIFRYNGLIEANVSGIFNAIFYPIILLHLLISINRLCSISMPLKYTHIFGGKNSIIMAFSIIAISIAFWSGFDLCKSFSICDDFLGVSWATIVPIVWERGLRLNFMAKNFMKDDFFYQFLTI